MDTAAPLAGSWSQSRIFGTTALVNDLHSH
jgi:hypothetical protein